MFKSIFKAVAVSAVAVFFCVGCGGDGGGDDNGGGNPSVTKGTFTDSRDQKVYKKVTIGSQTWMAENLNYDTTGGKCYGEYGGVDAAEGWGYYDTLTNAEVQANCAKYGRLYDWTTAMGIDARYNSSEWNGSDVKHRGICPSGWHLPSDAEWTTLKNYVGGDSLQTAGRKLKSTSGWRSLNGTDEFGFSGLPGGYRFASGSFAQAGAEGLWWDATEDRADRAGVWVVNFLTDYLSGESANGFKTRLYSVRCVAD